jgi:acyl-CoA synthetase (AMP-forming)/AMP-acid ligase II
MMLRRGNKAERVTMFDFFEWAKEDPERTAIVIGATGERYSRQEISQRAERMAQWLAAQGLEAGDRFVVFIENRIEFLELGLAARKAGLYMVPLNTHLVTDDIAYVLTNSGAKLVVASDKTLPSLPKLEGGLMPPCWTVDIDETHARSLARSMEQMDREHFIDLGDRPVGRELIYTSGTTGRPKGVLIALRPAATRGIATAADLTLAQKLSLDDEVVYLHPAPLYHSAPLRYSLRVLDFGGQVVLMDRFDPESSLALIERYKVTHSQWVPTMFKRMLDIAPDARRAYDLSSHRVAMHAAAPCPALTKLAMLDWWGDILIEYYAGSEQQGTTIITSPEWRERPGSVGRAIIGQIHIVDDNDVELKPGEIGRVYFSGGNEFEYLGDPEKTKNAKNSRGWGNYGDLGHVDEQGYLFLSDRRADLIISGGVNIYPQEIENVLLACPDVEDVAVVGIPDADLGEAPLAIVVVADGRVLANDNVKQITQFASSRLSRMQTPRWMVFVDSLPRSEAGKLLRRILKEEYRAGSAAGTLWPCSETRELSADRATVTK